MSELARRILIALVGIPLTVGLIYIGGWVFTAALGGIAALGAWELFRMARTNGVEPLDVAGMILAASVPLLVHASYLGVYRISLTVVALLFLALLAATIWLRGVDRRPLAALSVTVVGVVYPALVTFMYPIRYHDYAVGAMAGTMLVMFPITVTWMSDTGAYAFGRKMGRHKLLASVSPSKSVEGAIGGLVMAVVGCWLFTRLMLEPLAQLTLTPWGIVIFALALSIVGQTGDLAESMIKREAGVKDSSALLPGHGGILDRFDSQYFILPVAYLLLGQLLRPAPG